MPPPALKKVEMAAVREAILVESGVCAAGGVVAVGELLRSHPPQFMSDATKIALQWRVSMTGEVAVIVAGSTTVIGTWAGANALLIASTTSRVPNVGPGWSKTRTGRFGLGAPART